MWRSNSNSSSGEPFFLQVVSTFHCTRRYVASILLLRWSSVCDYPNGKYPFPPLILRHMRSVSASIKQDIVRQTRCQNHSYHCCLTEIKKLLLHVDVAVGTTLLPYKTSHSVRLSHQHWRRRVKIPTTAPSIGSMRARQDGDLLVTTMTDYPTATWQVRTHVPIAHAS
jgi:hypothetical protein